MARIKIPKSKGDLRIIESMAGNPLITNGVRGKGKISIPCRDYDHATEVLKKILELKEGGMIWL